MKTMANFLDSEGFIMQKDAKRENYIDCNFLNSNWLYLNAMTNHEVRMSDYQPRIDKFLSKFSPERGVFIRYYRNFESVKGSDPDEFERYTNPNHVSRDNSIGHLILLGADGRRSEARAFVWKCIKRGLFFQNTHTVQGERKLFPDLFGPSLFSTAIRSCFSESICYLLYPLLLILDVFLLVNILAMYIRSQFQPTFCSTVFHTASTLVLAKFKCPTPCSYLSSVLLLNRKSPETFKGNKIEGKDALEKCLRYYSRETYDPPIYYVAKDVSNYLRGIR